MASSMIIPEHLYSRLESEVKRRGFTSVEQFLAGISQFPKANRNPHQQTLRRIDRLRQRFAAKYGMTFDTKTDIMRGV